MFELYKKIPVHQERFLFHEDIEWNVLYLAVEFCLPLILF